MKIVVDLNRCQSYMQCCFLAPNVFRLEGEEALAYHPNPDDRLRKQVLRAQVACPMGAIMVEADDVEVMS